VVVSIQPIESHADELRYEDVSRWASVAWHTDVSFERVPADYSMLKINTLPPMGGDTLWINTADVS